MINSQNVVNSKNTNKLNEYREKIRNNKQKYLDKMNNINSRSMEFKNRYNKINEIKKIYDNENDSTNQNPNDLEFDYGNNNHPRAYETFNNNIKIGQNKINTNSNSVNTTTQLIKKAAYEKPEIILNEEDIVNANNNEDNKLYKISDYLPKRMNTHNDDRYDCYRHSINFSENKFNIEKNSLNESDNFNNRQVNLRSSNLFNLKNFLENGNNYNFSYQKFHPSENSETARSNNYDRSLYSGLLGNDNDNKSHYIEKEKNSKVKMEIDVIDKDIKILQYKLRKMIEKKNKI